MVLLVACSCGRDEMWEPDASFAVEVGIELSEQGKVGVPVVLSAWRRSGPWRRVRSGSAGGTIRLRKRPPAIEHDVQANLSWIVEPSSGARFNLPDAADPLKRTVTFSEPGVYRIHALNAFPARGQSNVKVIRVAP